MCLPGWHLNTLIWNKLASKLSRVVKSFENCVQFEISRNFNPMSGENAAFVKVDWSQPLIIKCVKFGKSKKAASVNAGWLHNAISKCLNCVIPVNAPSEIWIQPFKISVETWVSLQKNWSDSRSQRINEALRISGLTKIRSTPLSVTVLLKFCFMSQFRTTLQAQGRLCKNKDSPSNRFAICEEEGHISCHGYVIIWCWKFRFTNRRILAVLRPKNWKIKNPDDALVLPGPTCAEILNTVASFEYVLNCSLLWRFSDTCSGDCAGM